MSVKSDKAPCLHDVAWKDMCASCGMDLSKLDTKPPTSSDSYVSLIHTVPDLKVSLTDARIIDKDEEAHLLEKRKLHLLVDLDQTLIHTTNDNIPNNLEDVIHFQLWGANSPWYHTRLRPGTRDFLERINKFYQLHICTFGTRSYAHIIARHLDPDGKYFFNRILSRDECFSPNSKTANLKELFPNGDHMVCIIDDREDVWNHAPNLIHVKPYHFFRHTGDINAPPGLAKKDNDDKTGYDFENGRLKLISATTDSTKTESAAAPTDSSTTSSSTNSQNNNSSAFPSLPDLNPPPESSAQEVRAMKRKASMQVTNDLELSDDEEKDKEEESADDSESGSSSSSESSSSSASAESQEEKAAEGGDDESGDEKKVKLGSTKSPDVPKSNSTDEALVEVDKSVVASLETAAAAASSRASGAENVAPSRPDPTPTGDAEPAGASSCDNKENAIGPSPTAAAAAEAADPANENENTSSTPAPVVVVPPPDSQLIKVEDSDDYLLYLEDILKQIHAAFYSIHDEAKGQPGFPPTDVKNVIPYVRKKVLKGCSIVFSGIVPVDHSLESSRAYQLAICLGAQVTPKIILATKPHSAGVLPTTHIVAARPGTAKVNEGRCYKDILLVTADWLWSCAERWERVDEKMFGLFKKGTVKRTPPAHCSSPEMNRLKDDGGGGGDGGVAGDVFYSSTGGAAAGGSKKPTPGPSPRRNRTPSGRFMDTINPLLSFSMDEIESMGHEVDDICNESDSSSSDDDEKEEEKASSPAAAAAAAAAAMVTRRKVSRSQSNSNQESPRHRPMTTLHMDDPTSSSDSEQGESHSKRRKLGEKTDTETESESLVAKFRRGEPLPSDMDTLNLTNASSNDDDDGGGEVDQENEWMAQQLERELLGEEFDEDDDDDEESRD